MTESEYRRFIEGAGPMTDGVRKLAAIHGALLDLGDSAGSVKFDLDRVNMTMPALTAAAKALAESVGDGAWASLPHDERHLWRQRVLIAMAVFPE